MGKSYLRRIVESNLKGKRNNMARSRIFFPATTLFLLVVLISVALGKSTSNDNRSSSRSSLFVNAFSSSSSSTSNQCPHRVSDVDRTTKIKGGFSSTSSGKHSKAAPSSTVSSLLDRVFPSSNNKHGATKGRMSVTSYDLAATAKTESSSTSKNKYKIVRPYRFYRSRGVIDEEPFRSDDHDAIPNDLFHEDLYLPPTSSRAGGHHTLPSASTGPSPMATKNKINSGHHHITPATQHSPLEDLRSHHQNHNKLPPLHMSSDAAAATLPETQNPLASIQDLLLSTLQNLKTAMPAIRRLDAALFATYMCSSIAITTPVVLLPMIAAELSMATTTSTAAVTSASAFVATIASLSTLGGAIGKFTNGFVCQAVGGRVSATIYLVGMSLFTLLLAHTSHLYGVAMSGMEFCSSVMWTACTVMLADRYKTDQTKFATGITALSLASTLGTLLSKLIGTALLRFMDWRDVATVGALVALVGAGIVQIFIRDVDLLDGGPRRYRSYLPLSWIRDGGTIEDGGDATFSVKEVAASIRAVLGNRMFWQVGFAHAMAFLARSSDKILGTFFQSATGLPRYICGGLTASVTIGFVHGLVSGRKFNAMDHSLEKYQFLKRRYASAVISALALALCATGWFASLVGGRHLLAAAVALASGAMASSLSFQFYHLPPTFAKTFGKNKAVCLSFIDGMGFLAGVPIWAATSRIVGSQLGGLNGWPLAWTMLAGFFTFGGVLMMDAVPSIFQWRDMERRKDRRRKG